MDRHPVATLLQKAQGHSCTFLESFASPVNSLDHQEEPQQHIRCPHRSHTETRAPVHPILDGQSCTGVNLVSVLGFLKQSKNLPHTTPLLSLGRGNVNMRRFISFLCFTLSSRHYQNSLKFSAVAKTSASHRPCRYFFVLALDLPPP